MLQHLMSRAEQQNTHRDRATEVCNLLHPYVSGKALFPLQKSQVPRFRQDYILRQHNCRTQPQIREIWIRTQTHTQV